MHIIQEKWPEILNMVKTEHDVSPVSFFCLAGAFGSI